MTFPGFTTPQPEQTNNIFWAPNPPTTPSGSCSGTGTGPMSITADPSNLLNAADDTYQVLGSNVGPSGYADAVPVEDENGSSAARLLTVPFIRQNFPFKYIAIKYVTTGIGAGTFIFFINQMPLSTTLNG